MTEAPLLDGRYVLVERRGKGGVSVLWRGYDQLLGRPVAVKVLDPGLGAQTPSPDRIRTEAKVLARLSHPHIAAVHDYGVSATESGEHMPYLVMELLSGRTLADRLQTEGPLPVPVALLTCAQVASALAAAHAAGLMHRDVKPSNVMFTPAGVKLLDFGLASGTGLSAEREVFGPPASLAPERLTSSPAVPASDVFGLGLLLYAAVSGRLPWSDETVAEMLATHQYAEPAALPRFAGLPRDVRSLLDRCLARDPQDRPTASEVATGLADALLRRRRDRPWAAPAMVGSGPDLSAGTAAADEAALDRRGAAVVAAAIVTLVAVVGSVVGVTSEPIPPVRPAPAIAAQGPPAPLPSSPARPPDGVFAPPTGEGSDVPGSAPALPVVDQEPAGEGAGPEREPAGDPDSDSTDSDSTDSTEPEPAAPEPDDPEPAGPPDEPEPESDPNPPVEPAPATLLTEAGTLVVECAGNTASLVSADLLPGFTVVEPGPGPEVRVSALLLSVVVVCRAGAPSVAVEVL